MINLEPIDEAIQKRLFEKMRALGRRPAYSDSPTDILTQKDLMTRTTFIKMVSDQPRPVILMGGELKRRPGGGAIREGYEDIYGSRLSIDDVMEQSIIQGVVLSTDNSNPNKRPMPGIKSIDVSFKGGLRATREATVNWTCWSFEEISRLTPHFLSVGKSVLLEWGWVYNKRSLQNLPTFVETTADGMKIRREAYKNYISDVLKGKGDFDMMTGIVKNFEYTTRADGAFDCQTILGSIGAPLIDSVIPNETILDTSDIRNISSDEDKEKLIAKIKKASRNDDDLLSLDLNLSLKTFIKNIDAYIIEKLGGGNQRVTPDGVEQSSIINLQTGNKSKSYYLRWKKNQFLAFGDFLKNTGGGASEVWIRLGWFEDNIISKFTSMTTKSDVITEFRSLENTGEKIKDKVTEGNAVVVANDVKKGPNGEKIKTNSKGVKYYKPIIKISQGNKDELESVKIRNSKFLETLDLKNYILPGQFKPQEYDEYNITDKNGQPVDITLEGDADFIKVLAGTVNEKENFPQFKTDDDSKLGYLRNMMINTRQIIDAFGADEKTAKVESISINEAMENLFNNLNRPIDLWDFQLKQNEIDTNRIMIFDDQTTGVDFTRTISSQRSKFDGAQINQLGVFYFPVWRSDSIVKSQNITAKIPNALTLSAMYGSNLDQIKVTEPGGFGDKEGIIAGGLGNSKEESDGHKKGLDFGFRNLHDVGNQNGLANEPLTINGGKSHGVINYLKRKGGDELKQQYDEYAKKQEEKIKELSYIGSSTPSGFDDSKPTPLLSYLDDNQIQPYFEESTYENQEAIQEAYGTKYIITDDEIKMRESFTKTVNFMVTSNEIEAGGSEKNIPVLIPLEMELEIDGCGGIYPGNSYHSTYLPKLYQDNTVFQLFDVNHTVSDSGWTTALSGKMRTTIGQVFNEIDKDKVLADLIKNYNKLKAKSTKPPRDIGSQSDFRGTTFETATQDENYDDQPSTIGGAIPEGDVVDIDDFVPTNVISEEDQAEIDARAQTLGVPNFTGDDDG